MLYILIFLFNIALVNGDWIYPNNHEMKKIGESCITPTINGLCKLAEDCVSTDTKTHHRSNLCGFSNLTTAVCCPIEPEEEIKIIGTSCVVNTTSEKGMCKFVIDCDLLLDAKSNFCESSVSKSIVCCPLKKEVFVKPAEEVVSPEKYEEYLSRLTILPNSDYIRLTIDCIVNKTGEPGLYRILEQCPELQKDIVNGIEVPIICEEDFCHDLVCCPITKDINRRRQTCEQYDDPFDIIYKRLEYYKNYCITKDTQKPGTVISRFVCSSYDSKNITNNPRLCPFTFCEYQTCCEKPSYPDVCMYENRKYDTVRMDGNSCTDKQTGLPGTCRILHQCREVLNRNELNQTICGYDCCTPVVCCPERNDRSSEKMCSAYSEALYTKNEELKNISSIPDEGKECVPTYSNVTPHPFIVGSKQFPHMAALGYQKAEDPIQWECGGTLISEYFIMTAAHCLQSAEFGPVKYVLLGVIDLDTDSITDDCPEEFLVDKIIPHPKYTKSSRHNDIGLLRLSRTVTFTPYIRPACLSIDSSIPHDLIALGWGATGAVLPNNVLVKVLVTYYNHTECAEVYKNGETQRFKLGIIEESQMCAGSTYDIFKICVGFSGGPIMANHIFLREMATIYGISSYGRPCDFVNSPAVYTKVFPYVKWIESIVWP